VEKIMESLTEQQKAFLKKRTKMVHSWPALGVAIILLELGLAAWLLWKYPLLINPQAVMTKLRSGSLPDSTLSLMATILPFLFIICLGLLAMLILFAFLALANEKKHMDIIQALQKPNQGLSRDR
jgi:type VI protein secretion system component VasF